VLAVEEDGLTLDEMDAELDTKTSLDIALDTTMELEAAIELDGLLLDATIELLEGTTAELLATDEEPATELLATDEEPTTELLATDEEPTTELLATDEEGAGVDEDRIDDEGTASHFPKPGWHPVPQ
jgi:hypothetical protein